MGERRDQVMQIGNIVDDSDIGFKNPQRGRIYDTKGISPCLNTCAGGGLEPKILTAKRTEFGKSVRKQYEKGELKMSRHDMTTMVPREDGLTNTLISVQKDNYLAIPEATKQGYAKAYEGDSVNIGFQSSKTRRGKVGKQMANTLDTGCQQGVVTNYRIRKLTPRECFRLMGVDDADIDKIQLYPFDLGIKHPSYSYEERLANMSEDEKRTLMRKGISNSQQYKMAGNSIVVDTLYHIFRTMFIDKGKKQAIQQTLF